MEKFIIVNGEKFYSVPKLEIPNHDDYFIETGTVEFHGHDEPVGHFDECCFQNDTKKHWENASKHCENKAGYYCKCGINCKYPNCLK